MYDSLFLGVETNVAFSDVPNFTMIFIVNNIFIMFSQVSAFKSDGRRQRITYSFGYGNEANVFDLGRDSGVIRVRDSRLLNFELHPELSLVVVAQVDNGLGSSLYGYAPLKVFLEDQNDNVPIFTQNIYTASVLEGKTKGTFVVQVRSSFQVEFRLFS